MDLREKLAKKKAIQSVIGLGYVGMPLAVEFAKAGLKTVGIDIDEWKVEQVGAGKSYIGDVGSDELSEVVKAGGYANEDDLIAAIGFGKTHPKVYSELTSEHPIDLTRYQVVNCYMGRVGLINSGGASGKNDLAQAVRTAVINKRAGGMGLISGRKTFQKPLKEGIELFHAIQDVYLDKEVSVA